MTITTIVIIQGISHHNVNSIVWVDKVYIVSWCEIQLIVRLSIIQSINWLCVKYIYNNIDMSTYDNLSILPWHSVDMDTWEVSDIVHTISSGPKGQLNIVFETNLLAQARKIAWNIWESYIQELYWSGVVSTCDKTFDWELRSWNMYEVKTCKVWNCCVIKKSQLEKMPNSWYYFLIYYSLMNFNNMSDCIKYYHHNWDKKLQSCVKNHFLVQYIYMLPKSDIVWMYNQKKSLIVRNIPNKNWSLNNFLYAPIRLKDCKNIIHTNPGNFESIDQEIETKDWKKITILWHRNTDDIASRLIMQ